MGSRHALFPFPRQTNSLAAHFGTRPNAEIEASMPRPRSTSRNSEPSISTSVGNETLPNEKLDTPWNIDSITSPNIENGPSVQRPRRISRHSDPAKSTQVEIETSLNNTRNSNLDVKKDNRSLLERAPSMTRQSDPSMKAHFIYVPSSPYEPGIQSHLNDLDDPRYVMAMTGHIARDFTSHHAGSTPDLRVEQKGSSGFHQQGPLPLRDIYHNHSNLEYSKTGSRDSLRSPLGEVERSGRLVSRSMSDLSNLGNDSGHLSHPPTALQRTFEYPGYGGVSRCERTFYSQPGKGTEIYNSGWGLRSSGSVPDLSTSFSSLSAPYAISQTGRSSPTPSQLSDVSSQSSSAPKLSSRSAFIESRSRISESDFSLNDSGYGSMRITSRSYEQVSPRESENLRSESETPSSFRRDQYPSPSNLSRSLDNSLLRNGIPANTTSTVQSSSRESDSTSKSDNNRKSYDKGRGRTPTLNRAVSLSNFGEDKNLLAAQEMTRKRRDSLPLAVVSHREKHPLANVPIPSFREFKEKNLEKASKGNILAESEILESLKSSKNNAKDELRLNSDSKSKIKERLSSLYESCKDISAKNASRRDDEQYKLNCSDKAKIKDPVSIVTSKELNDSTNSPKERKESPFSKNEVIHQLMLKYGLYSKADLKSRSPEDKKKDSRSSRTSLGAKETTSDENKSERTLSPTTAEKVCLEDKNNTRNSTDNLNRVTSKESALSNHNSSLESSREVNNTLRNVNELKKSAAERFRELKRKSGLRNDVLESSPGAREVTSTKRLTEDISSESKDRKKNMDPRSPEGDFPKCRVSDEVNFKALASEGEITADTVSASTDGVVSDSPNRKKGAFSLKGTSRAILCANQFKRTKKLNSPGGSPLPNIKLLADIISKSDATVKDSREEKESTEEHNSKETIEVKRSDSPNSLSPSPRRHRFLTDRGIRRGGIHTSMLSVASSTWSDTDLDDSVSISSELDSMDDERGTRGRRWDSFHSNISADSGSAHLYEYETDSNVTEYEDVFDEQDSEDDHPKGEADVERTDSGVGGDLGQSHLRRSWEEIVMKSSEQWSVVAASARHWQELARRRKAEKGDTPTPKKKTSSHSLTEDMVECPDCLKHYVPPKETNHAKEPMICSKCEARKVERKEAIIELVQTEINYGNDLQILKEEFYLPMQSGGILNPENLAAIFLNLQELLEVNSKFCAKLQKSLELSVAKGDEEFSEVNVGVIFLESVDFFQAYEIYCAKQTAASSLLESLQKKTELLRIFLNVTCRENPKCRKMDLNSFILAPVQRIMKYPLLLSRIYKATPRRNTDREKLKMAQRKIEEQLNKINALNTAVESRQKRYRASQQLGRSDSLDKLQMKKMASDILNWTTEEMQLLMHGVFQVTIHEFGTAWNRRNSKKALSVCALFCVRGHSEFIRIDSDDEGECEDMLFPGESDTTDAAIVLLRKKLNGKYTLFKDPLFLDMCVIYRDSDVKDAFEVVLVGKESYLFKASNSREYRRWLKYLRLESKELGSWKRRRNGLPNIMIKNL
ncbi:serine-rich adhesin for platelets-like isoform X2 [Montipora foliosa]